VPRIKTWFFILSLFTWLTSSCTSGPSLKEVCDKTNWEDRARSYADRGQNLPDSEELRACSDKIDPKYAQASEWGFTEGKAHYCSPESARSRGIGSRSINDMGIEFCGPEFTASFTRYHTEGQITFCAPKAARAYGLSGQVYQSGQCPAKLEKRFLKSYYTGRSEFLREKLDNNNDYLQKLEMELLVLKKQSSDLVTNKPILDFTHQNNPKTLNVQSQTPNGYPMMNINNGRVDLQNKNSAGETSENRNRREALMNQDSSINNKIQRLLVQQNQIRTQNREYEAELKRINNQKD
jgi:hypothetical protein